MSIRAVIWDLGGVLVRTNDFASRAELAAQHGMSREALEELVYGEDSGKRAQLGLIDVSQHWENVRTALRLPDDQVDEFRTLFWGGDRLDVGLIDFIRDLKREYRTGLLSNAFSNLRQVIRETWQIADAFDAIVISAEEGVVKPDPRIYRISLDRLEVQSGEALFIDDMRPNVDAARRLGMQAVQFLSAEQARSDVLNILNSSR